MFDFLEKLAKKPENQRRLYAVITSLGVTAIIFVIWLSVILPTSVHENVTASVESSGSSQVVGPIKAFGYEIGQAFQTLKEQLGTLKGKLKIDPTVYEAPAQNLPENEAAN